MKLLCLALIVIAITAGQALSPAKTVTPYAPPKTPWGDPDLQGVWPGTDMVGTPLERPRNFGTRNTLTEEEFSQRQARSQNQANIDSQETVN